MSVSVTSKLLPWTLPAEPWGVFFPSPLEPRAASSTSADSQSSSSGLADKTWSLLRVEPGHLLTQGRVSAGSWEETAGET